MLTNNDIKAFVDTLNSKSLSNEQKFGSLGEFLVKNIFNLEYSSEDLYYDGPDLIDKNNKTVEVKTQVRWLIENSFCLYQTKTNNNLNKCLTADRLIFVEPGLEDEIRIYDCVDRSYKTKIKDNKEIYLFAVDNTILLYRIKSKILNSNMIKYMKTPRCFLTKG